MEKFDDIEIRKYIGIISIPGGVKVDVSKLTLEIRKKLAHQNKRLNEQCEKIVNRELKSQAQRIIKRLEKIVEKGAPSEQDNVIKYGAMIWEGIHRIIEKIKEETK